MSFRSDAPDRFHRGPELEEGSSSLPLAHAGAHGRPESPRSSTWRGPGFPSRFCVFLTREIPAGRESCG